MKIYIILPLYVALFFSGCSGDKQRELLQDQGTESNHLVLTDIQVKSIPIRLSQLESRSVSSVLLLSGFVDVPPQNMVSVSMPLGGYLKSTHLLPGMRVRKGEVIATMEDIQYVQLQQDYLSAKSQFEFLEAELARQLDLNQSQASSDKVYQQAATDFKRHQVLLKGISEKLALIQINPENLTNETISRRINLYSPIDGFVAKVNVNIGKYVSPTDVLFEMINPADIHLNLTVFEKDIMNLQIGQEVLAYTNNHPAIRHKGEIILISKSLSGNAAEVHCHFDEYDETLLPGTYMNAEVETGSSELLTLPEDALVTFEGKEYVFQAVSDREYHFVEVKAGIVKNGYVEILNPDLLAGKNVAVSGSYTLLMVLKNLEKD